MSCSSYSAIIITLKKLLNELNIQNYNIENLKEDYASLEIIESICNELYYTKYKNFANCINDIIFSFKVKIINKDSWIIFFDYQYGSQIKNAILNLQR